MPRRQGRNHKADVLVLRQNKPFVDCALESEVCELEIEFSLTRRNCRAPQVFRYEPECRRPRKVHALARYEPADYRRDGGLVLTVCLARAMGAESPLRAIDVIQANDSFRLRATS